ncbi:MAG: phosphotransferase enzyme family protein [Acidobacteriota bacterium]
MRAHLESLASHLDIEGDLVAAEPWGSGHINDTFAATYDRQGSQVRYIHQIINQKVFEDPVSLMENVVRVTRHVRDKLELAGTDQVERRVLSLVASRDGASYYVDEDGNFWRTYVFIEGARTYDLIESAEQAHEIGRAFGAFQRLLLDLPGARLAETIPNFHDTPARFSALKTAIDEDIRDRCASARTEIDFIEKQAPLLGVLLELQSQGRITPRVTHNDTKLNNVMIDDETSEGICVIDLDTVMPGIALYDFGDMVRTATATANEDERDLSKVTVQMQMFEALSRGYLSAAGEFLSQAEKDHLVLSGQLMTLEAGIRFLTDYLNGDTYFKVQRRGHNLDRCRSQLRLYEELRSKEEQMQEIVAQVTAGARAR